LLDEMCLLWVLVRNSWMKVEAGQWPARQTLASISQADANKCFNTQLRHPQGLAHLSLATFQACWMKFCTNGALSSLLM
jgi:hypothetical protein